MPKRAVPARVALCWMAFCAYPTIVEAGAQEGHLDSMEPTLTADLINAIARNKSFSGSRDSPEALRIKAFLWDNRHTFQGKLVKDSRTGDAAICILRREYGHRGFERYVNSPGSVFQIWCEELIDKGR